MKQLQEILKYTKDLVEQEPEKSAFWHYNKLVSKIEEAIDVIHCCEALPTKNYEVDFSNHLMAGIQIVNGEIKIVGAVDGWGNGVTKDAITIKEV